METSESYPPLFTVRNPEGSICLYTKGADTVILERLHSKGVMEATTEEILAVSVLRGGGWCVCVHVWCSEAATYIWAGSFITQNVLPCSAPDCTQKQCLSAAHRDTLRVSWALTSDAPFTWPHPSYSWALRPSDFFCVDVAVSVCLKVEDEFLSCWPVALRLSSLSQQSSLLPFLS